MCLAQGITVRQGQTPDLNSDREVNTVILEARVTQRVPLSGLGPPLYTAWSLYLSSWLNTTRCVPCKQPDLPQALDRGRGQIYSPGLALWERGNLIFFLK